MIQDLRRVAPLLWRVTPNAESAVAALEQLTEKSMHSIRCLLLEGDTPRQLNERQYLALLRLGYRYVCPRCHALSCKVTRNSSERCTFAAVVHSAVYSGLQQH